MKDIEESEVFKQAHALVLQVYHLTESFPKREIYGLSSQIRRAALSVTSNLVEGAQRMNRAEYRHFVSLSKGSAAEARYQARVAYDLGYLPKSDFDQVFAGYERVIRMLRGLHASLDGSRPPRNQEPGTRNQEQGTPNGFTLLELVIVIVLVSVLAAVALSRMSGSSAVKLDQATRMVAGDMQLARDWAMTHATSVRMMFDLSAETYGASYWSVDASGGAGNWQWISAITLSSALYVDLDDVFEGVDISEFIVDGGALAGTAYTSVGFSSLGSPRHMYDGTNLTGGLQNRIGLTFDGLTRYVSVQPSTGYIYVCTP